MVSSLFIGTTGFFQTYLGYVLLGMDPNILICSAVFLVTFSTYSLNKLTDAREDAINMPERQNFLSGRRRMVLVISLLAYALAAVMVFIDKPLSVPIIFIPIAANAVYSSRLVPGIPRLKDIPVMKSLVVAISWTLVCMLLPAADLKGITIAALAPAMYFMLAKVFINAVLYDIRDIKGDKETGVCTMPVLLGAGGTMAVLLIINSSLLPLIMMMNGKIKVLVALMAIYGYIYTWYFRERRGLFSLDFFVDGQWMLAAALLSLLEVAALI